MTRREIIAYVPDDAPETVLFPARSVPLAHALDLLADQLGVGWTLHEGRIYLIRLKASPVRRQWLRRFLGWWDALEEPTRSALLAGQVVPLEAHAVPPLRALLTDEEGWVPRSPTGEEWTGLSLQADLYCYLWLPVGAAPSTEGQAGLFSVQLNVGAPQGVLRVLSSQGARRTFIDIYASAAPPGSPLPPPPLVTKSLEELTLAERQ
ncbi:MAG: hypothetical protein NZT92_23985, partial [Abditibacteriales bacterium]|nr:hypothetical protein [Abditibacteriales bacterium]